MIRTRKWAEGERVVFGLRSRATASEAATAVTARAGRRRGSLGIRDRATTLLGEALASDDAEAVGVRADAVLADTEAALIVLGAPGAWPAARHAVVQRYGRVGALLVVGYEGRWRARSVHGGRPNPPELEELLDRFAQLEADELARLLAGIDRAEAARFEAAGPGEEPCARRWMHATYAVAARDGTYAAHRAYMTAFDGVVRLAARRLAS